ncbi:Ig domain-containing protein [Deinococcus koreensis]|uniref:Cell ssuface protein containing Ig-like domain protein n=1 Tax=Deinococcus koreensis TaxID=2054903 RepID=A0A2K3UWF6_9DEIO|nr:Ig domain-containing protein [Deinococcus koreensis]PNY80874.1 cell ssuface protein containing Ig-like domain protein [Deinococcus koreensis]
MSSPPLLHLSGRPLGRAALALLLGVSLAACGQQVTGTSASTGKDVLYFADSPTGLPPMYVNETYTATLPVAGGVGPYTLRVTGGTLPPGLSLNGSARQLSGKPTKTGTYKFTLEVTDSTLSTKTNEYTVNVQELPPLALTPTLPTGEIRGETRIPLTITAPRGARAAHLSWELPENVKVTRIQSAEQGGLLFWRQEGRMVLLDVGFKTVPRSGSRIALISVKPSKAATLTAAKLTFEARDAEGRVVGAPPPAVSTPTAPTAPAAPATPAAPAPTNTAPATAPAPAAPATAPATAPPTEGEPPNPPSSTPPGPGGAP